MPKKPKIIRVEKEEVAAAVAETKQVSATSEANSLASPLVISKESVTPRSGGTRVISMAEQDSLLPEDDKRFIRFSE